MTKTQLLTSLNSKFYSVEQEEANWRDVTSNMVGSSVYIGFSMKLIPVLDKSGEAVWDNSILIMTNGTDYYWKNGEPKSDNGLFPGRVLSFIDTKIADGTIKYAVMNNYNQTNKKANVTAIMPDKTTKTVLLTETTPGTFTLEVIS